jgi:hypothetical protein
MMRGLKSWKGKEEDRNEIREVALRVRDTDASVRVLFAYSVATGLICEAIRNKGRAPNKTVACAAQAQIDLQLLHSKLVQQHGMDFDFVRREWATILDPSPNEKVLCDKLAS